MQPTEFEAALAALTRRQRDVLTGFLAGKSDEAIATALFIEPATVRRHLANICKDWALADPEQGRASHREELVDLVARHKPDLIHPSLLAELKTSTLQPEFPGRPLSFRSPFYIERSSIEARCIQELQQPGSLIRMRAPRHMGKTSLLNQILPAAQATGLQTVRLNLRQAEASVLQTLDTFLQWFAVNVTYKLGLSQALDTYWDTQSFGSLASCTIYFQSHILPQVPSGLVLSLDEIDWLFVYPDIAQGFFALLRGWHEEANSLEIWQQLRLVVAHSTEVYIPLNIHQSPFNVGLPIRLSALTLEQTIDLAGRYGVESPSLTNALLTDLHRFVGGHPYLVQLALYHLHQGDRSLPQLLQSASTQSGIYGSLLRNHWQTLQDHPELLTALKQVIQQPTGVELEPLQAYQLESMGLVMLKGNQAAMSCELYQQYFSDRFKHS